MAVPGPTASNTDGFLLASQVACQIQQACPLKSEHVLGYRSLGKCLRCTCWELTKGDLFSSMPVKLFSAQGLGFRSLEKK